MEVLILLLALLAAFFSFDLFRGLLRPFRLPFFNPFRGLFRVPRRPGRRRPRNRISWPVYSGETITGKANATDGDGIRISGYTIRLTGIDAPEWGQVAKHQYGYWFNQGKRVNSALINAIGGKHVQIAVRGYDKYGRVVGSVTCEGKDVGVARAKRIRSLRIRRQVQRHRARGTIGPVERGCWEESKRPTARCGGPGTRSALLAISQA